MDVGTFCDELAQEIDDVSGDITKSAINSRIRELCDINEISEEHFLETFSEIYLCDPATYATNAKDDAEWALENGLLEDNDNDYGNLDEFTQEDARVHGIDIIGMDDMVE